MRAWINGIAGLSSNQSIVNCREIKDKLHPVQALFMFVGLVPTKGRADNMLIFQAIYFEASFWHCALLLAKPARNEIVWITIPTIVDILFYLWAEEQKLSWKSAALDYLKSSWNDLDLP